MRWQHVLVQPGSPPAVHGARGGMMAADGAVMCNTSYAGACLLGGGDNMRDSGRQHTAEMGLMMPENDNKGKTLICVSHE